MWSSIWKELVEETTLSSAYSSVRQKFSSTKTISLKLFSLYFYQPNNRSSHDPEISVKNNAFFPLYFHVPSCILVLDLVGYHNCKTSIRHPHYAIESSTGIQQLTLLIHFSFIRRTNLSDKTNLQRSQYTSTFESYGITLH